MYCENDTSLTLNNSFNILDEDLPLLSGEAIFRDNHGTQYHIVMPFTSCPSSLTLDKRPYNLPPESSLQIEETEENGRGGLCEVTFSS